MVSIRDASPDAVSNKPNKFNYSSVPGVFCLEGIARRKLGSIFDFLIVEICLIRLDS